MESDEKPQHIEIKLRRPDPEGLTMHLRSVVVGEPIPSEEHIRVWEAWLREFPQPPGTLITAALVNRAVEWWNGLRPEAERDDGSPTPDALVED